MQRQSQAGSSCINRGQARSLTARQPCVAAQIAARSHTSRRAPSARSVAVDACARAAPGGGCGRGSAADSRARAAPLRPRPAFDVHDLLGFVLLFRFAFARSACDLCFALGERLREETAFHVRAAHLARGTPGSRCRRCTACRRASAASACRTDRAASGSGSSVTPLARGEALADQKVAVAVHQVERERRGRRARAARRRPTALNGSSRSSSPAQYSNRSPRM